MNNELRIMIRYCLRRIRKLGSVIQLFSYSIIFVCNLWAQSDYLIEPLSLNNNYTNEIYAVSYQDGIVYSTDRRTHVLISRVDSANHPLFHLYFSARKDSNKWSIPNIFSKNLPINAHQGPFTISANGREIYYSVNDETGQRIFTANRSGNDWSNIRPFAYNRPNYTTTHPSLSRDGKRLFFASDMPGGFGGFDIYFCEMTPRGWSSPRNLGPEVNTKENELYPFIQGNGELYFSSSAHGSMGGLDIFSVREMNGTWGLRHHLEEPINSASDDISYTATDANGTHGYFASNRAGKTFDLFSFKSLFPVFANCAEQEENDYTYWIREQGIMNLDTIPTVKLIWDMGDGTTEHGEEFWHTFPSTGQYDIYLSVLDTLTGEFRKNIEYFQLEVLDIEQPYITASENVETGTSVSFDASKTYLPDFEIEEYYWMFGDGTRKKSIRVEHTYIAPGVYDLRLGVTGRSISTGEHKKACVSMEIRVK